MTVDRTIGPAEMSAHPRSLRQLLMTHEAVLVLLVVLSGGVGGAWGYTWQQWSAESIRLNLLLSTAQEIKARLFQQIQEVSVAGLREEETVAQLNAHHSRAGQELFNVLRRTSVGRAEGYAVQDMQQTYSLLQNSMREALKDLFVLNRLVRARVFDPDFEQRFIAEFDAATHVFLGLLLQQRKTQDERIALWSRYAPFALVLPIVFGLALVFFSRGVLRREFIEPVREIMSGTAKLSSGELRGLLPEAGASEVRELAQGINQMALDLANSQDALLASERQAALGSLVPVVAHNIRNPLAAIRANAQLLSADGTGEELLDCRQAIMQTVDRLERWVSALVSYLHPLKPTFRKVVFTEVLSSTLGLLQDRLEQQGIDCAHGRWDNALTVDMDPDLMEQALFGLLNNALEASARGQTIEMAVWREGEKAMLMIRDWGGGLPFEPKPSGLEPGPSTKRFGTGLGIPVAYKICAVHGFDLEFVRRESQGTDVLITAPLLGHSPP